MSGRDRKERTSRAQSLVELAAGMMVFVPVILLLIDCSVLMIGQSANESACRDAARAASAGPPASPVAGAAHLVGPAGSPYKRAQAVIKNVYALGGLIKISQSLEVKETLRTPLPEAPVGGPYIGEVVVETTAEVYPPFLIRAFSENGIYQFKSSQSYPYTYVMPPS